MADYRTLDVCPDCYRAAAYGVGDPGIDWPPGFVRAWQDECRARGVAPVPVPVDEHGKPEGSFSHGGCPWCGATQGGMRFPVTFPATDAAVSGCGRCDESGVEWCATVPGGCIRGRA